MTTHARSLVVFNVVLAALVGLFLVACSYVILNEIALAAIAHAVAR